MPSPVARPFTASLLLAMASLTAGASSGPTQPARHAPPAPPAPADPAEALFVEIPGGMEFTGELTVRPRQDMGTGRAGAARARLAGLVLDYYHETDEYTIRVPDAYGPRGVAENRFARELLATGDYQYVHPNWLCYPTSTPNDTLFGSQWHLQMIEAQAAWNLVSANPSVVVAVTDSGILTTHEDLTNRVPGFNAVDDLAEADGGRIDALNNHGTHVAGCAAPAVNNGVGVAGPGWGLGIMMIRVSNHSSGGALLDDITQGARWAIEHGAVSVSSSYTGVENPTVETTGAYIRSLGGVYLYAANNYNQNHSGWDHPSVIVVGASNESDAKADFSSYGRGVDVFAPGVAILSTIRNGGYKALDGTSMATPVANGVVGMMLAANPSLTPEHVERLLTRTCKDWGPPGDDEANGWGRINMRRAIEAAVASVTQSPPLVTDDAAVVNAGESVTLDVLANDVEPNMDGMSLSIPSATPLGGTLSISPGTGLEGRDRLVYHAPPGGGHDVVAYEVVDEHGNAATARLVVDVRAAGLRTPDNPARTAPGVLARYYEINGLSILPSFDALPPYAREIRADVNIPSTEGPFAGSGRAENVGAAFTGYVTVPVDGSYTFSTTSDDGSRLYVGHALVVNNDGLHGMETRSGSIGLRAGTHRVRAEFFERSGGAGMVVSIAGPGLAEQPIPSAMWSRPCDADTNGSGDVDILDFLDFLNAFSACDGAPAPCLVAGIDPDANADGEVDILDFLSFLDAFSDGC